MSQARATTDHKTIQRWAEARGGSPATVKGTQQRQELGILRLDFDPPDESLKKISWKTFFKKFDEEDLAFLYQEETDEGGTSRFHKFVNRESLDEDEDVDDDDAESEPEISGSDEEES